MKDPETATARKIREKVTDGTRVKIVSMMLAITLLGVLPAVGGANLAVTGATPAAYNNVQVLVHATSNLAGTYTISAYNSSGWLVAFSQSKYPAASFELPSATYLFTVNVFEQYSYSCYASAVPSGKPEVMPSCQPYAPKAEYGYSLQQVTSSTTLSINTEPLSQTSSRLSVTVDYVNGTAASNVSVSAYVVGGTYWWGDNENNLVMFAQTGRDGVANLAVPNVPVEVTAWKSVPVILPKNETTVQTIVAGEKVNVTVYWQPTYVGLGGSALILPPLNNAKITLHFQQPNYQVMPYGVQGGVPSRGSGTIPGTAGVGSLPYLQAQSNPGYNGTPPGVLPSPQPPDRIPSFPAAGAASTNSEFGSIPTLTIAIAAVALASITLAITVRRRG